jgi:FkbM family methyltransferase
MDLDLDTPQPFSPWQLLVRPIRVVNRVAEYCRELGVRVGLQWFASRVLAHLRLPGPARRVMKPRHLMHAVNVELHPSSDEYVFNQIFIRHEYAPLCERVPDPKFILDLGANVGYASALFASRYPQARILAVEPDPRNFELCRRNLAPYGDRIMLLNGAVWTSCSRLALTHEFGRGLASQVKAAGNSDKADVEAWDIPTLLDLARVEVADIVKIDIEGTEAALFASGTERWLPRARNICIELHGQRYRNIFFRALEGYDYEAAETGEFTMCLGLRKRVNADCREVSSRSQA